MLGFRYQSWFCDVVTFFSNLLRTWRREKGALVISFAYIGLVARKPDFVLVYVLRHKAGQEGRGEILLENSFMR